MPLNLLAYACNYMYLCMKIAIFYSRLFQKSHKNVSIVKVFKKFLYENYPIASAKKIEQFGVFWCIFGSDFVLYIIT